MITKEVETGENLRSTIQLPRYRELQKATSDAVAQLLLHLPPPKRKDMEIMILEADESQEPTGEVYILRSVLDNYLKAGLFRQAETELGEFLRVRRSEEIETRAHFYLAQAYYFQNRHRKALLEFLLAQDDYPRESRIWLQACFEKLIAQD
jgi:TolA-binding protein